MPCEANVRGGWVGLVDGPEVLCECCGGVFCACSSHPLQAPLAWRDVLALMQPGALRCQNNNHAVFH